jgi:putative aminopeptidase FrvX
MDKKSEKFLLDLLNTNSPSGKEEEVQRVWLKEVASFAKVTTDLAGNAIGVLNEDAPFKVMLAGHCDEIGMMVSNIDEKGFVSFVKAGGINPRLLAGLKVEILGYAGEKIAGVVGFNLKKKDKNTAELGCEDFFIDCGYDSPDELKKLIRIGDYIVYKSEPEIIGKNRVVCKGLDNKTGSFIVAEVLRALSNKKLNVAVYGVSTTGEETNMRGAHAAASKIRPNIGIACDVTFNTDLPNEESPHAPVAFNKGPAISVGSPINPKVNQLLEEAAGRLKMPFQIELATSRTYTDADKIMFSNDGVPVALVSLPLRYMHSPIEMASMQDMSDIINLLVEAITALTGKEDLRPLA